MPFRQKLRKTFSRSSTGSNGSSSTSSSTMGDDIPCNPKFSMYQPGERIPYKYRRPVERAHREKLEAFTFDNAWKRCSHGSQYSPMGSRMPSRKNSVEQFQGMNIQTRRGAIGHMADLDYDGAMSPCNGEFGCCFHAYRPVNLIVSRSQCSFKTQQQ